MLPLLAALSVSGVPATPDPYAIFAQARHVWAQQHYPDYLTYTVAVDVTERGVEKAKHYHLAFDALSGKIGVNPVSDEELAAPPDPNGVTLHLIPRRNFQPILDKQVGNPGEAVDYLGVPIISPTYSFGMTPGIEDPDQVDSATLVQQIRQQFDDPVPQTKVAQQVTSGDVKTIASITTFVRHYTITDAGEQIVGGVPCYHLLLHPTADPRKYRLRELWVDTSDYQTRQLISSGNFTGSNVPWLITFANFDGAEVIASETALAPVGVGAHHYDHASVSFEDLTQAQRPSRPLSFFVTKETLMSEPDTDVRH